MSSWTEERGSVWPCLWLARRADRLAMATHRPTPHAQSAKSTAQGDPHLDPAIAGRVLDQVRHGSAPTSAQTVFAALSEREIQVLWLLARGLSNQDSANELLSWSTVYNQMSTTLDKLDVEDRAQAPLLTQRHGLTQH